MLTRGVQNPSLESNWKPLKGLVRRYLNEVKTVRGLSYRQQGFEKSLQLYSVRSMYSYNSLLAWCSFCR
jgi:hypothetical protein